MQFGWGSKQRRIQAAEIDCTSAVAESHRPGQGPDQDAAARPPACRCRLGRPVSDADDAWAAARKSARCPVVVKPQDGNQGKGVTVNLDHARAGRSRATPRPSRSATTCWSSASCPASDYRFLVVGNKLVAAARREPPHGASATACTPCASWSTSSTPDPRRGDGHATSLTKIRFDDIAHRPPGASRT